MPCSWHIGVHVLFVVSSVITCSRPVFSQGPDLHTRTSLIVSVMPLRVCSVSFKSATGITHAADAEAETLYEAAGMGLARLQKDGWIDGLGPGSRLEIQVREPSTIHSLTV
jgi:hypothetical protein